MQTTLEQYSNIINVGCINMTKEKYLLLRLYEE